MIRRLAILLAVVAAGLAVAAVAEPKGRPLVGIVGNRILSQQLFRFDASTLAPLPGGVPLAGHRAAWSFSPSRATLVLARNDRSCLGGATTLRFVDLAAMRMLGDVPLVDNGPVEATVWLDRSHVLAVVDSGDCIESKQTMIVVVDAETRRVVATTRLRGEVVKLASAPQGLVLLLAPRNAVGTARLAVVDAAGKVRETTLTGIRAGQKGGNPSQPLANVNRPGLAVDPATGRAFVVPAGDRLAEIDLGSLGVRFHDLAERVSTFTRLRRWLEPPAAAKGSNGPYRQALWLGNGLLAVTGSDTAAGMTKAGGERMSTTPAGLRLVDTRDWRYRKLSPDVSSVQLAGGLLLGTGSRYSSDGTTSEQSGAGLLAYSLDGHERYHLFGDSPIWIVAGIGTRGYAELPAGRNPKVVSFAVASGEVGPAMPSRLYELLVGDAFGFS